MIDMKHGQHLWVTMLAPAKQQKTLLGKCGCSRLSLYPGSHQRTIQADLGTFSPPQGGQGEGKALMAGSPALHPTLFDFFPAHPVIENGQVECPQGYKTLNRSHCQGKAAAFISLSPSHIHCQSCSYLHE